MKKIVYIALVLAFVMVLSACGAKATAESSKPEASESAAASTESSESEAEKKSTDAPAGEWNKIDKSVSVDGIDYTISAYKKSKSSELFEAEEGKVFLLIDMTVKNSTAEEAPLSSIMMFELTDADGKVYDISLGGLASLEEEKIEQADGEVPASSELRCGLAYEIPENAKGIKISVKELLGEGKKTVDLF